VCPPARACLSSGLICRADFMRSPCAFPHTNIVLNHVGSPILGGPYAADRAQVFTDWKTAMAALAKRPNVTVKLGALPIRLPGPGTAPKDMPPSSEEIATAWRPWLQTSIDLFGPSRCMFESNFPVQKRWSSYQTTWNAFKRIAADASPSEKADLFAGTAARVYGLPSLPHM
jgi:L-fuconolactonase